MSVVSPSFRSRVRAGAEPIARGFGRIGLTPNMLTLIGFAISVIGALLAAAGAWLPAGVVIAAGSIFDLFDGALARATGRVSRLGAFLDSTFDRAGEAGVYIGVAIGLVGVADLLGAILAAAAMAAGFMVSYTRAKSESLGFTSGTGMASIGIAPREVRIAVLVIGLLLAVVQERSPFNFNLSLSIPYGIGAGQVFGFTTVPVLLDLALAVITVLATITTIQRIYHVYQQAKKENHG